MAFCACICIWSLHINFSKFLHAPGSVILPDTGLIHAKLTTNPPEHKTKSKIILRYLISILLPIEVWFSNLLASSISPSYSFWSPYLLSLRVLLFVDEADAFLRKRSQVGRSANECVCVSVWFVSVYLTVSLVSSTQAWEDLYECNITGVERPCMRTSNELSPTVACCVQGLCFIEEIHCNTTSQVMLYSIPMPYQ